MRYEARVQARPAREISDQKESLSDHVLSQDSFQRNLSDHRDSFSDQESSFSDHFTSAVHEQSGEAQQRIPSRHLTWNTAPVLDPLADLYRR